MLDTSLDDVGKHQNVESTVFFNMQYHEAHEDAIQDPDNVVADPTDLAVKLDSNWFNITPDIVYNRLAVI